MAIDGDGGGDAYACAVGTINLRPGLSIISSLPGLLGDDGSHCPGEGSDGEEYP